MTKIEALLGKIGAALLAVVNALSGAGIVVPDWADAQGVNLFSAFILAGAVAWRYVRKGEEPAPETTA